MYGRLAVMGVLVLLLGASTVGCARKTVVVAQGSGGGTYVKVAGGPPAAPKVLVTRPAAPSARHIWVNGHYVYQGGRYVWVKGRWAVPPRARAIWVPGHYDARRGVWVTGHWK